MVAPRLGHAPSLELAAPRPAWSLPLLIVGFSVGPRAASSSRPVSRQPQAVPSLQTRRLPSHLERVGTASPSLTAFDYIRLTSLESTCSLRRPGSCSRELQLKSQQPLWSKGTVDTTT